MEKKKQNVFKTSEVMGYSPKGYEESFLSKMLMDEESVGSSNLTINEFTLYPGKQTYMGSHPKEYNEIYYALKGKAWLYLEGSSANDVEEYLMEPGSIAFIQGGKGHYLKNDGSDNFVLLTIMPGNIKEGINMVYDSRLNDWGTSFRLINNEL